MRAWKGGGRSGSPVGPGSPGLLGPRKLWSPASHGSSGAPTSPGSTLGALEAQGPSWYLPGLSVLPGLLGAIEAPWFPGPTGAPGLSWLPEPSEAPKTQNPQGSQGIQGFHDPQVATSNAADWLLGARRLCTPVSLSLRQLSTRGFSTFLRPNATAGQRLLRGLSHIPACSLVHGCSSAHRWRLVRHRAFFPSLLGSVVSIFS